MPSIEEGWPMALMEAISMNCICIISDAICYPHELPISNLNFMFKSGDEKDLAKKLEYVLNNQNIIRASRVYYRDKAPTWNQFANHFFDIIKDI